MRSVFMRRFAVVVALAAALFCANRASAAIMTFDSYVNFAAGSSIGGTALGSSTPVHIHGTFDNTVLFDGGFFALAPFNTLTFDVTGVGVFSAAVPSDLSVLTIDQAAFGAPVIGITNFPPTGGYYSFYTTTTNPFVYNALTPNAFSDNVDTIVGGISIALADGAGDLLMLVDNTVPTTTVLANEVPEPSTSVVFAVFGAVAVVGGIYRRRRDSVARDY